VARAKKNKEKNLLDGIAFLEGSEESVPTVEQPEDSKPVFLKVPEPEPKKFATAFGRNTSKMYATEVGCLCPNCRFSILQEDISFSGKPCEFFVYCPNCNAHICTYQPMPHQEAFHKDEHMKKLYAGGFGSAKT
jgi:hypothetical protein